MSQKRNRSVNWDEEERHLLQDVLKNYSYIIENKSLSTNVNKSKTKAWEEIYKVFNELNYRQRKLSQLQVQWKLMKANARKKYSDTKTGDGRPCPDHSVTEEVKDLMKPAELLRDYKIYDSGGDGPMSSSSEEVLSRTYDEISVVISQDPIKETSHLTDTQEAYNLPKSSKDDSNDKMMVSPNKTEMDKSSVLKRKLMTNSIRDNVRKAYMSNILSHSKRLKNEEYRRRMEMAEEEHSIKMQIHQEKLTCAILERQMLRAKTLK